MTNQKKQTQKQIIIRSKEKRGQPEKILPEPGEEAGEGGRSRPFSGREEQILRFRPGEKQEAPEGLTLGLLRPEQGDLWRDLAQSAGIQDLSILLNRSFHTA